MKLRRSVVVLMVAAGAAVVVGPHMLPRYPARGPADDPARARRLERRMNAGILSDLVVRRLTVEVDWVEGCRPASSAIDALRDVLTKYGPARRAFEIHLAREIPKSKWGGQEGDFAAAAQEYLEDVPAVEQGHDTVYILYTPKARPGADRGLVGEKFAWALVRGGHARSVSGFVCVKDAIRRNARLWITADEIERGVVVHEFGHVLGLVSNPAHARATDPSHCTHLECVMGQPSWRVILANLVPAAFLGRVPHTYCPACEQDIRDAQALWEAKARASADYAASLRNRRLAADELAAGEQALREGRLDERLLHGEAAVRIAPEDPDLRERLAQLLYDAGRRERAAEEASAALRRSPGEFRFLALRILCATGHYREAAAGIDVSNLRAASPRERLDRYQLLTRALEGAGQLESALAMWTKFRGAASTLSERRTAAIHSAELLRKLRRFPEAEAVSGDLRALYGDHPIPLVESGRLALAKADLAGATALFHQAAGCADRSAAQHNLPLPDQCWFENEGILAHALAGESSAVRNGLAQFDADCPATFFGGAAQMRVRALAILGDEDGALAALQSVSRSDLLDDDFCLDEDLSTLRREPLFQRAMPQCDAAGAERSD